MWNGETRKSRDRREGNGEKEGGDLEGREENSYYVVNYYSGPREKDTVF